jgi:hypothetical protein
MGAEESAATVDVDGAIESGAVAGPAVEQLDERSAFRIVRLSESPDGGIERQVAHVLITPVHDRQSALRQATYDAKQMQRGEALFVVLDPGYRTVGVVGSGSGRATASKVARKARIMAMEMFPSVQAKRPQRRSGPVPTNGRGSRKPPRKRWS